MGHADDEPRTPRITGSYLVFMEAATRLHEICSSASLTFAKRLDVIDLSASRRCKLIAELAEVLREGFDEWTREPPTQEERAQQIDSLMRLREEAREILLPLGVTP